MLQLFNLLCISLAFIEFKSTNKQFFDKKYYTPFILLHIYSQNIFLYIVYISSFTEAFTYTMGYYEDYMNIVPLIDEYIAGTSLNLTCISGIMISKIKYKNKIPSHINEVINSLIYFGIFWAIADKTTQMMVGNYVFYIRLLINIKSCLFVSRIKKLMTKPFSN
jgi:hypothetical protein